MATKWGKGMYKRKTYIINKEFQYGLIATFLIIVVCSLLLFSTGFIVYYFVTGLVGENAYDEFIEITQQVKMKIQPIRDDDIVKPNELAQKIKDAPDPVSKYIRQNLSVKDLLEIDYTGKDVDEFEIRKKLQSALNTFLQNAVRRAETFYTEDRFRGVFLPKDLEELARKKQNPQSLETYSLNLRLLAAAYPDELKMTLDQKPSSLVDFEFQRAIPGLKRYELVLPPVIINNLLLMLIIIIVGIFYSHRIAGPIYRLEQDIMRVLGGERNVQIRLRQKDKLKPLAEQINRLINEFEKIRGK
jgi:methyl-accepting chemotaxis protein